MPGVKLATAYYELIPSMAGNQAAITAQMGAAGTASSKSFSSKFAAGNASALKAIGIAGAAAAAVGFIKGSIAEAREAQKVGALTANVIKTTGGAANVTAAQVGKLSGAISAKTGIDDEAVQTGANLLLTFKNVQNQAGAGNKVFNEATQAAVDLSASGFGSIDSASKMLGKALNDPVKGISALGRAGVTFTQGQKDQIEAMVKSGDVLGAQKIILGEVKSQVSGAAAAQATAGDKMSVAWGNLQETIGTKLTPALDMLLGGLTKVFTFIGAHQSVMIAIGTIIGVVLVAALVAATVAVWSFTVALLANPIVWIIVAIIALIAGIVLLVKNWDLVKAKTLAVWNAIKTFLVKLWDGLKAKMSSAWDAIKAAVISKAQALLAFVKTLPQKILDLYLFLPKKMLQIGADIVDGLKRGISGAWHFVTDKVKELIAKIPLAIRKLMGIASPSKVMMELGAFMAEGLALGIDSGQPRVRDSLRGVTSLASTVTPASQPTQLYMKSGALRIVDGQAYIEGVVSALAFDAGMAATA